MGRGRGKGKRGGRGGGGRQHFISSLEELEARNVRDEAWASRRKAEREEQEDSESGDVEGGKKDVDDSESDEEDRDGSSIGASAFAPRGEVNAEVVEPKKARPKGVQGLIEVDNPNAKPKSGKMMKAKDMDMSAVPVELSRREREALEAQRKKENYMKLHAEGKTHEAQVDLARLVEVRKRREEAERRRVEEEAEAEATREKMEKAAKESAAAGPQKLNPLEVKKMNPTRLKELLKERGQSLQGSKKDLISRLLQWEKDNQG